MAHTLMPIKTEKRVVFDDHGIDPFEGKVEVKFWTCAASVKLPGASIRLPAIVAPGYLQAGASVGAAQKSLLNTYARFRSFAAGKVFENASIQSAPHSSARGWEMIWRLRDVLGPSAQVMPGSGPVAPAATVYPVEV